MDKKSIFIVTALSASLCLVETASGTPISASMNLQADATTSAGASDTKTSSDSWGTPLSTLNVAATATANDATGSFASAFGSGSATWAPNGLSGSVDFTNYGWNFAGTGGSADLNQLTDWTYTFVADGNGAFTMAYNVTATGTSIFGLWGWSIIWNGVTVVPVTNGFDPTASGSITQSLIGGQTYTISLQDGANVFGAPAGWSNSMSGAFDWTIQTSNIPEPATVGLVALGLLGMGAQRRKRA